MFKNSKLLQQIQSDPFLRLAIPGSLIFILLACLFGFSGQSEKIEIPVAEDEDITTHIPRGFVLVPIELKNFESIDAIMGKYGVVDIYEGLPQNRRGRRVASHLKMIRAPLNPSQFGVLVPDHEAAGLMGATGPLIAVLQNSKHDTFAKFLEKKKPKMKVEYYQ